MLLWKNGIENPFAIAGKGGNYMFFSCLRVGVKAGGENVLFAHGQGVLRFFFEQNRISRKSFLAATGNYSCGSILFFTSFHFLN